MRTKEQYIQGLSKMRRNVYLDGELIDRTDERQMDCLNTIGTTFEEAAKPEYQDLCTAISHLTGERINRFNHIHQNTDDLHKKQDMTRMYCQKVAGCIQRCLWIYSRGKRPAGTGAIELPADRTSMPFDANRMESAPHIFMREE